MGEPPGMFFGKSKLNLEKETNLRMARALFDPIKETTLNWKDSVFIIISSSATLKDNATDKIVAFCLDHS